MFISFRVYRGASKNSSFMGCLPLLSWGGVWLCGLVFKPIYSHMKECGKALATKNQEEADSDTSKNLGVPTEE